MSVVGIDIGDETCKVAVARRAGIDVLQNKVGRRKTETMISYTSTQRLVGSEAPSQYMSTFNNTAIYMKRFLGKTMDESDMKTEVSFLPVPIVSDKNNRAAYEINYNGNKLVLTPEQVMATMLVELKAVAEYNLDGVKVKDCVITVPHYFTNAQRQAMLDAAQIAGLNVLRLMNESTAVALQYGMTKGIPDNETRQVLFYDIGHSSTNVAVASFTGSSKMTILGVGFDRQLGGRDIDEMLVAHFAKIIQTKYKMDVFTNIKALMKMRKECSRVKHLLSATPQCQFNIEYLMDGKDATALITRKEFDEMVMQNFGDRLVAPVKAALGDIDISTMSSFEIIGGTSRVPIVQTILKNFNNGKDLSKTCDSDESIARGATLQCAMISPSVKTKEYQYQDVSAYSIDVSFKNDSKEAKKGEIQTQNVFTPLNPIPSVKMMTFKDWSLPVELTAAYPSQATLPQTSELAKFTVAGGVPNKPAEKIKVRLALDANSIMSLQSAQILEEYEVEEKSDAPAPANSTPTDASSTTSSTADGAGKEQSAMDVDAADNTSSTSSTTSPTSSSADATTSNSVVKKRKVKRTDLVVSGKALLSLSSNDIRAAMDLELDMAHKDRIVQQTFEARNAFESYTLDMRSRLSEELKEFVKPADAEKFISVLREAEAWLEDHEDEEKKVYDEKLHSLKEIGFPILQRFDEFKKRDEGIDAFKRGIAHWQKVAEGRDPKYAHIDAADMAKIAARCKDLTDWLAMSTQAAFKGHLWDEPIFTYNELITKANELEKFVKPILNKPAPKAAEAPKQDAPKDKQQNEQPKAEETNAAGGGAGGDKPAAGEEATATNDQPSQ